MKKLLSIVLLLSAVAMAHDSGHGPVIEETGPNGGKLTAVVAAADAERGREAPLQMMVEHSKAVGAYSLLLFDKEFQPIDVAVHVKYIIVEIDVNGNESLLKKEVTYVSSQNIEVPAEFLTLQKTKVAEAILTVDNEKFVTDLML